MEGSFRILVYAIVAVAVLALVYLIIWPFIFPVRDNVALIEKSLEAAETGLGTAFSTETFVQKDEGIKGSTFDSRTRNVNFICNNADLCCPLDQECSLQIEWNAKAIEFNESKEVLMASRCELQHGLFICNIYVGEFPAQVEIGAIETDKKTDLSQKPVAFEVTFSNTGSQETQQAFVEIEIYQMYLEEGKWVERLLEEYSKTTSFGNLKPGQTRKEEIQIEIDENGRFKAKAKISGLEAGYEEKSIVFDTVGGSRFCAASSCESPRFSAGECKVRCHCEKCLSGTDCQEKLAEAGNEALGLPAGTNVETAGSEILGSNIIDITLNREACPSDLIIAEPKPATDQIGFKAENIGESPVQNSFEVTAYTGYGTGSKKKIGSITIDADGINEEFSILESVIVALSPGTHDVELVVNEERTENEKDYENNNVSVTVEVPEPVPPEVYAFENPDLTGSICCGKELTIVRNLFSGEEATTGLIDAVSKDKIRADFAGEGFSINARIQNTTNEGIRIRVPLGQIFTDKDRISQNLAKEVSGKVIKLPMCSVWIGNLSNKCLNLERPIPTFAYYNVGGVVENAEVLAALQEGNQGKVWREVKNASTNPKEYGSENVLVPIPTNFLLKQNFSEEECREAGLI